MSTAAPSLTANEKSSSVSYTVFISHAGEDKATIAIPLREKLSEEGISAFVDEADMPSGTDSIQAMTHAMETAKIGVFILSPEFIAKKWPMKELMHFLQRREEISTDAHSGREPPRIIPCFYRLSVGDMYNEPKLSRLDADGNLLYEKTRFFERLKNGEPEADLKKIDVALKSLHKIMGVRNDFHANNSSSTGMIRKRELLLEDLCKEISMNVPKRMRTHTVRDLTEGRNNVSPQMDTFRPSFPPKLNGTRAVLDFDSRNKKGHPITPEGQIKHYLVKEEMRPASIVSLCGLGGVGKSTIVEVLMSDDDVRRRFKDGVHLIRLGSDATDNTLFECICSILEGSGAERKVQSLRERRNIDEVLGFFMAWFEGRSCIFFIDDVWEHSINVRALSRLCDIVRVDGGNRILITTRERDIATLSEDARIVILHPGEVRGEVSRKILMFHAAIVESEVASTDTVDTISEILDICAGLPVSLAVAGKSVRKLHLLDGESQASAWARYLSWLQASRQALLVQNVGSYRNLFATFAASLRFLDERAIEERLGSKSTISFAQMHRRLCVLQKQQAVPNTMLMHLWETESEQDAEMIAMAFVEIGLAGRETVRNECESESRLSLHDSVHDFATSEAQRHNEIADVHNLLLEGYSLGHEDTSLESNDNEVRWWSRSLEDDGYIHKQLCRHLVGSGRKKELRELLLTPLWAERQIEVNGSMYLDDDFSIGMKEITKDEETREVLRMVANAVSLSSVHVLKNPRELWFQLHGRLKGYDQGNGMIEKYVKRVESTTSKPRVLSINRILVGAGGRNRKMFSVESDGLECMALFPDGERVACGCRLGRVVVINIRSSEIEREWVAYETDFPFYNTYRIATGAVLWVAVAQNGTRILTRCSHESSLDVWDVANGHRMRTIGGYPGGFGCFAITYDATCVVSISRNGSLQLKDLRTGEEVITAINVGCDASAIEMFKDGVRAIVGQKNGKLKLWNTRTGSEICELRNGVDEVISLAVTSNEHRVVSVSKAGRVTLWDLGSLQQVWSAKSDNHIESVSVSKDGKRFASGNQEGSIQVWDVESGDQYCEPLKGHTDGVTGVSFVENNDLIVSSSWDGTIRVWNAVQGQNETSFKGHSDWVTGVCFTPNGKFVVTGSNDHTLRIWDVASQETVGDPLCGHLDKVYDVAVTPDGRLVVSVSWDKTVRVWDLESRRLLQTFEGHDGYVLSVAVLPEGDRAVTVSMDNTMRIWDLAKMDGSHAAIGPEDGVSCVFVSDDGLRAISVHSYIGDQIFVRSIATREVLKTAVVRDAYKMSRREIFGLIGEYTAHDDAGLSIPRWSKQIIHGQGSEARVLATFESEIAGWDISPDKKTICLGFEDGRVAFMKVDV